MASWKARNLINEYTRDYCGGALMLLIGVGAVVQGLHYDVGTLGSAKEQERSVEGYTYCLTIHLLAILFTFYNPGNRVQSTH